MNYNASLEFGTALAPFLQPSSKEAKSKSRQSKLPKCTHKEVSKTPWVLSRGYGFVPAALVARRPRGGPAVPRLVTTNAIQPPLVRDDSMDR